MVFYEYYDVWNRHGVKLTSGIEITKEVLDQVNKQNQVCDLIWAINAAEQNNKSVTNLSYTVMDRIRKLSPVLLNHNSFKKYSSADDIEERAVRHFTTDPLIDRFAQRQTKIRKALEGY